MSLTALLIEDDPDLAQTVIDYLELEHIVCDHASNGISGLQLLSENQYDVLLLDLNLPRLDGISVCERLRDAGNELPILMLTARDQLENKLEGFKAGTDDYLVKPFELDELIVRIQALAKRRSGQAKRLSFADLEMDLKSKTVTRQGQSLKLSPTHWKILEQLIRYAPEVIAKHKLEQAIWGEDIPDSNNLKVQLHHLRKVVDVPFDKPLIQTIPGHGFALRDD